MTKYSENSVDNQVDKVVVTEAMIEAGERVLEPQFDWGSMTGGSGVDLRPVVREVLQAALSNYRPYC